jgi:hypothetical protein
MWLPPQTPFPPTYANSPPGGDLPNPAGSGVALDSPWALRELEIAGITGDPERLVSETRKEYRDARKYVFLVPFQQVEFYAQSGEARDALHVSCSMWWEESWTSPLMMVPIPPVVTYRASMLLSEKKGTPEYDFWWRSMEVEWAVLVFGRWCADIQERTIMWLLPVRARRYLDELKVENIFHRSPYNVQNVGVWLQDHDAHNREVSHMFHRVRGPSKGEPPLIEERPEFLRPYNGIISTSRLPSIPRLVSRPIAPQMSTAVRRMADREEIVASGRVIPRRGDEREREPVNDGASHPSDEGPAVPANAGWMTRE